MNRRSRFNLIAGSILVLIGIFLLALQFVPNLQGWFDVWRWPFYVIAVGILLAIIGLLTGEPDMAVPACVVGGIGCILYWQNATDNWDSWAYAWTLIPGFVGVGQMISGLFGPAGERWKTIKEGFSTFATSIVLFLIFGSFFGFPLLGDYWPILLILVGLWTIVRGLLRRS